MLVKLKERTEMENKVAKLLLKWGYSESKVNEMIKKNLEIAVKSYPEAKPSFIADVVCSL